MNRLTGAPHIVYADDGAVQLFVDDVLLLATHGVEAAAEAPTRALSRFAYVQHSEAGVLLRSAVAPAVVTIHDTRVLAIVFAAADPADPLAAAVWALIDAAGMTSAADPAFAAWSFADALALFGDRSDTPPRIPAPPFKPPMSDHALSLAHGAASSQPAGDLYALLRERRTRYRYDDTTPITREQLSAFLFMTARAQAEVAGALYDSTRRLYPAAGAAYELELYIVAPRCTDLARGLYHYDPAQHALEPLKIAAPDLEHLTTTAVTLTGRQVDLVQVLILITARLARINWKRYALLLAEQNSGVLMQTFYLAAAALDLAPCALGSFPPHALDHAVALPVTDEPVIGGFLLGNLKK